ncbi:sensor histidine kinase [Plebeiibacterium sediminum]|uniref:Histidine kinase n=1 Tax=Plebeiibacterium sediminum TaxID=2992112 RepID=A0AAE3SEJ9_9BACT|nr:histidine kinase [Plebeiobacterium sediminum]MCW3785193.1 histidine kinase [Plebeiobacterium sediminum]
MSLKYLYKTQIINILVALIIGVFIVFPDVVRHIDQSSSDNRDMHERGKWINAEHTERPSPPSNNAFDKIPPPPMNEERLNVFNDSIQNKKEPFRKNGEIPPDFFLNRDSVTGIVFDFVFFFVLTWILLAINNPNRQKKNPLFHSISDKYRPYIVIGLTLIICYIGVFLNSFILHYKVQFHPFPRYLDGIAIFKGLFIFVSVVLFGQLYQLLYKQQNMVVENEKLKTESLQNRFEALSAQISPHFFFNSLNSLSGLVRENQNKKALKFINEISNLFRYILKGNWQELVTLKEEIFFLKAYQYLLDIKYEDKLLFEIEIDEELESKLKLPALSLQPLVENIIKHNIISEEYPMTIRVYINVENKLIIENRFQPKAGIQNTTGIGLNNLSKRYRYLAGKEISNYIYDGKFIVELPLTNVENESSNY